MIAKTTMTTLAAAILALLVFAEARAQSSGGVQVGGGGDADGCAAQHAQRAEGDDAEPNYRVVERDGRRVFVIEQDFVICGRVPRPNVIYVLQASAINYQWENLKQDFLPKIQGEVRQEPF